jgi:hypothetical protein
MDSRGQTVAAQLFGTPAYPNHDVYYADIIQPPAPLLFTEQDTIWSFSAIGNGTCQYFTTYEGARMFTASVE